MNPDITTALDAMSVSELAAHIDAARTLLDRKREDARQALVRETRAKAESLGFSFDDLFADLLPKKPAARPKRDAADQRRVPVKYRDPVRPENAWTGRGMMPKWLREKTEAGARIEDFLAK